MHTHHGPGTPGTDLAAPLPRQRFSSIRSLCRHQSRRADFVIVYGRLE